MSVFRNLTESYVLIALMLLTVVFVMGPANLVVAGDEDSGREGGGSSKTGNLVEKDGEPDDCLCSAGNECSPCMHYTTTEGAPDGKKTWWGKVLDWIKEMAKVVVPEII